MRQLNQRHLTNHLFKRLSCATTEMQRRQISTNRSCRLFSMKSNPPSSINLFPGGNNDAHVSIPQCIKNSHAFSTLSSRNSNSKGGDSLRRLASPFILLCHPDKLSSIESAQKVNLNAVQTLNNMIDVIESASKSAPSHEVKNRYAIEFVVPSKNNNNNDNSAVTITSCTRREVTLTFPSLLLEEGRHVMSREERRQFALKLGYRARFEIKKLLLAAGISVDDAVLEEDKLVDDVDDRKAMTHYERSRDSYMRRVDTNILQRKYERFIKDMYDDDDDGSKKKKKKDVKKLKRGEGKRRTILMHNLIARVKLVETNVATSEIDEEDDDMGVIEQVVALRRLSLLLRENYDYLDIPSHEEIWKRLVILLNPVRRTRRQRKGGVGETGFKFALEGDGVGGEDYCVTVTVPIDFRDNELIEELKFHMQSFYFQDYDDMDTHSYVEKYGHLFI